jgi:photosystem II stability/assembly factor-like uncharacterized protein
MKSLYLLFIFISTSLYTNIFADWQLQNPKFTNDVFNCQWADENTAFLGGHQYSLLKTSNRGSTWQLKTNGIEQSGTGSIQVLRFLNTNTGYVLAGKIYKTINGGELWFPVSDKFFWKADVGADGVLYAIDENFKLVKTVNDGSSWTTLKENVSVTFTEIKFLNALTGFYTESSTVNLKTTDGGNTWVNVNISQSGILRNLTSISFANENVGYALMEGRMLKTTDKGLNWFEILLGWPTEVQAITENIVVGSKGGTFNKTLIKSFDGGITWNEKRLPEFMYLSFYNPEIGFGFYNRGLIYKIENLGETFTDIRSKINLTAEIINVQPVTIQKAYMLSSDHKFYSTQNGGTQWNLINTNVNLKDFKFLNENSAVGSTATNIVITQNGGASWEIKTAVTNAKDFEFVDENNFYFLSTQDNFSYVRKTTDGGESNNAVITRSNSSTEYYTENYYMRDLKFINQSTGFVAINRNYSSRFGGSQTSFQILKTTNAGSDWEIATAMPNASVNLLYFYGNTAYLCYYDGLYKSTDFCQTWTLLATSSGNIRSLQFTDNNTAFAVKGGGIYKSIDGGATWVYQCYANTANRLNMFDSNNGYAFGEAGTVYHTDNGGSVGITPVNHMVKNYSLSQNYPNPFNPATKINFSIPKSGLVQIIIYDLMGREVKVLVNEFKTTGEYSVDFNGSRLSSGVYFYKLITDDFVETKKMMLVK